MSWGGVFLVAGFTALFLVTYAQTFRTERLWMKEMERARLLELEVKRLQVLCRMRGVDFSKEVVVPWNLEATSHEQHEKWMASMTMAPQPEDGKGVTV